jgi:hypothetical protein
VTSQDSLHFMLDDEIVIIALLPAAVGRPDGSLARKMVAAKAIVWNRDATHPRLLDGVQQGTLVPKPFARLVRVERLGMAVPFRSCIHEFPAVAAHQYHAGRRKEMRVNPSLPNAIRHQHRRLVAIEQRPEVREGASHEHIRMSQSAGNPQRRC